MFTGLIEGKGIIRSLQPKGQGYEIYVESEFSLEGSKIGDSIAVDGVCLTVVNLTKKGFSAHLSPETISRTTFKLKKPGQLVNLERALKLGDPLGGHLVSGHVDGIALIKKILPLGDYYRFEIEIPQEFSHYLIPKGSIAIDGISLTINEVSDNIISLMIIPHTYRITTLHTKKVGDYVNFEIDMIAKMVYRWVKPYLGSEDSHEGSQKREGLTLEFLAKHGFA